MGETDATVRDTKGQIGDGFYVASGKALDTVYTNNTKRNIQVVAVVQLATVLAGDTPTVTAQVDRANPPTFGVAAPRITGVALMNVRVPITFIVPPGFNYRLLAAAGGGTVALQSWQETPL